MDWTHNGHNGPLYQQVTAYDTGQLSPKPVIAPRRRSFWGFLRHVLILTGVALSCLIPSIILLALFRKVTTQSNINDGVDPNRAICKGSEEHLSQRLNAFFGITYSVGHLTWKEAKAVEVVYNLVVARGIQALLVWISYRLFMGALLRNAETTALPYDTYASMAFQHGSAAAAWQLFKGAFRLRGARGRLTMLWLLASTCWILVVPTFLDLMSGYVARKEAMVTLQSTGFLEPWANVTYTTAGKAFRVSDKHFYSNVPDLNGTFSLGNETWAPRDLFMLDSAETAGVARFGTAKMPPFVCVNARDNSYEWGMSGGIVLVWIPAMALWAAGMYVLWFDVHRNSQLWRRGRRLGMWRAALDLAGAIAEDLGPEHSSMSNEELEEAIGKRGPVTYYELVPAEGRIAGHIGLSSRAGRKM